MCVCWALVEVYESVSKVAKEQAEKHVQKNYPKNPQTPGCEKSATSVNLRESEVRVLLKDADWKKDLEL